MTSIPHSRGLAAAPEISIIVPCYNEAPNVRPMIAALRATLDGICDWEVIFVDDNSPDGTARIVSELAQDDSRVRVLRRVGRRGLSSAVIEGFLSSSARFVAVIDGDLQHDETALRPMLAFLRDNGDLAVASRHVEGGDSAGLAGRWRQILSRSGIRAAQALLAHRLTDPMSGFFAMRRETFEQILPKLSGTGFKILLDLVMSAPPDLRVREVPVIFRPRVAGESKLDTVVLLQFGTMLLDKLTRGVLPTRFFAFALVGLAGVAINVLTLNLARKFGMNFSNAQILGTFVAIAVNFVLNNRFTYHDRRLRRGRLYVGFALFLVGCSIGAIGNVGVAHMIFAGPGHGHWDRSSAAGAVIGVVWNYAVSSTLIWR